MTQHLTRVPELLIPAGNLEKLRYAIRYGADAVYVGGKLFSLRAASGNFDLEDLAYGIDLAHSSGVRVYVTVNAMVHNEDIPGLRDFVMELAPLRPDAFIVADPGALTLVRELASEVPVHLSTQANTVNVRAAKFWESMGVRRIVLGRELSLDEIRAIRDAVSCQIETFVHGAMCISYSGRCLLSNFMSGRDANRGECTQTCRWKYHLVEETRPGQYFEIGEDDGRGTYILNSKDLCMVEHLKDLIECGIDSLKVEGRMKSVHYVASVTKAYRMALTSAATNGGDPCSHVLELAAEELDRVSHRPYTTGFFYGKPGPTEHVYGSSRYVRSHEFVGNVLAYDETAKEATVYVRNRLSVGELVEMLNPGSMNFSQIVAAMYDTREGLEGVPLGQAHANYVVKMPVDHAVQEMSVVRRPSGCEEVSG